VNEIGYDSGIPDMSAEGDLPLVQDDTTNDVWANWAAAWRDVDIVDADGALAHVYNLTTYDLAEPDNYETFKVMLVETAEGGS
jgi:hypothetical protein